MTPDLFPGGVSLWKEVSVLGTLQQMLPSAVTGVMCLAEGRVVSPAGAHPCLSLSPLSFYGQEGAD